jgi:CheY-like chemotaxis protein
MLSNQPSRQNYQDLARWEQSAWVLVVDDDDDHREAMVETLEDAGYRALGIASGDQALEAIHDQPFLVLTDFRMPGMNGSELLTAMQAELGSRMPPVVFLTGASPSMIDNIAAQVLSKPVDLDQLLSVVGHHCPPALAVRT